MKPPNPIKEKRLDWSPWGLSNGEVHISRDRRFRVQIISTSLGGTPSIQEDVYHACATRCHKNKKRKKKRGQTGNNAFVRMNINFGNCCILKPVYLFNIVLVT